jgi:hypothetical protein
VTVKETKSGQVTSYVSDVPSNNSLVASDAPLHVAPTQTRATPPRSSTGVEQTTSPGALVTPPSPKVPSYVRVAASASGYSGYSSYSSLPRPAKARLSPAPASSPPQGSPGAPSPAERSRSAGEPRLPTAADHVDGCDVVVSRAKTEERDVKEREEVEDELCQQPTCQQSTCQQSCQCLVPGATQCCRTFNPHHLQQCQHRLI